KRDWSSDVCSSDLLGLLLTLVILGLRRLSLDLLRCLDLRLLRVIGLLVLIVGLRLRRLGLDALGHLDLVLGLIGILVGLRCLGHAAVDLTGLEIILVTVGDTVWDVCRIVGDADALVVDLVAGCVGHESVGLGRGECHLALVLVAGVLVTLAIRADLVTNLDRDLSGRFGGVARLVAVALVVADRVLELDLIDALGQFRGIDGDFARLRVPRHALVVGLHIGDVRGTTVLVLENAVVLEQVGCGDGHGASAIDIELVITGFGVTEVVLRDRDPALVILVDTDDARLVGVRQIREHPVLLGIGHTLPDSGGGPAVVVVDDEDFAILGVEVVVRGVAGLDTVIEDSAVIVGVVEVALEVDPVDELLDVDIAGIRCRVVPAIVSVVTIIATAVVSTAVVVVAAIVSAAVVTVIAAVTGVVPVAAVIAPVAGVVGVSAVVVVSG